MRPSAKPDRRRHLAAGAALLMLAAAPALAQTAPEYAVKAAYLHKFGPFVEWPPGTFDSAAAPVTICVVGQDPFGQVLDRAVEGQRVGARSVVAKRLARIEGDSGCHIAYITGGRGQSVSEALAALKGRPVLTVTDSRTSSARGMVHFAIQSNRVRFHIDSAAAAAHRVTISSKLLSLALSVRRGRG